MLPLLPERGSVSSLHVHIKRRGIRKARDLVSVVDIIIFKSKLDIIVGVILLCRHI